jgi:hypothetical protein
LCKADFETGGVQTIEAAYSGCAAEAMKTPEYANRLGSHYHYIIKNDQSVSLKTASALRFTDAGLDKNHGKNFGRSFESRKKSH